MRSSTFVGIIIIIPNLYTVRDLQQQLLQRMLKLPASVIQSLFQQVFCVFHLACIFGLLLPFLIQ